LSEKLEVHFIDVGIGNMVLLLFPDNKVFVCDCNITNDNENEVLTYVKNVIGAEGTIDIFVNSHRDADHMRGIKKLHAAHTIHEIWDGGAPGTTTTSPEYKEYMDLKNKVTSKEILPRKYWTFGDVVIRSLNSKWDDYSEANDHSIVLRFEYKNHSLILTGDTSYKPWKEKILPFYSDDKIKCDVLLASHHGSLTFFNDPSDEKNYFTGHIKKLKPDITVLSVGPNVHDLPDNKSLELYELYTSGSSKGNKIFRTDKRGNIKVTFPADGSWSLV
jgi:beta-lactamase superfamily II metal-dependent hydrolase